MIMFTIDPVYLTDEMKRENLDKLREILRKFDEADKELTKVCKELGIPKPEMTCCGE